MEREVFANVVLKNGKLLFWWTGDRCSDIYDFNKDFYYSGLNMMEELEKCNYELKSEKINSIEDDKKFYKQFELHEEYRGQKPY